MNKINVEADKNTNEVKEYSKHVDAEIERKQLEIKALDGLVDVCRKFDGKVLNKRFRDAVQETTKYVCQFGLSGLDFFHTEERDGVFISFNFSIPVVWSLLGYHRSKKEEQNVWRWNTGDRLEAEKAVAVIEHYKKERLAVIENLKASKKKYAAYLRLARKAEAIMKEMKDYNFDIREYAKENVLSKFCGYSHFWIG